MTRRSYFDTVSPRGPFGVSEATPLPSPHKLPFGYLSGLTLSSDATDATNDIAIAAGVCCSEVNKLHWHNQGPSTLDRHQVNISIPVGIVKQLDAAWAPENYDEVNGFTGGVGVRSGGRSGSSLADGLWHVFAIGGSDTKDDILFHDSTVVSSVLAALPGDFTAYRHLGSFQRSSNAIVPVTISSVIVHRGEIVAIVEDQKAQNTAGQTFATGSDQVRELTTLAYNRNTLVSLASNRFTLPAGTWEIAWDCPAVQANANAGVMTQSLLFNFTDTAVVARSTSAYSSEASGGDWPMNTRGSAVVTIAASKAFEVRQRVSATSINGGVAANFGTEVYTRVVVRAA